MADGAGEGDGDDAAAGALRTGTRRGRLALAAAVVGSGMVFLDTTAVNVALPALGDALGADLAAFQWVVDAYLLSLAALLLPAGALADRLGRRRVFRWGVVAFAATSLACGAAPSVGWLIAFRVVQGAAGALLVPASLALVQASFRPRDRGRAIGAWSGWSGLSTLVGPILGGWLVQSVSWRAVFFINPVFAVAACVLAARFPESRDDDARGLDLPGALLGVAAVAAIVFFFVEGPGLGWRHPATWGAGAAALVLVVGFLVRERRAAEPMLPLAVFRNRRFAAANVSTLLVYSVLGAVFFLLTLELQRALDYTPLEAGAAGAPVTLLLWALSPRAGAFAEKHGPRLPLTVGPLVGAVGVALLVRVEPGAGYLGAVLPALVVFGLGLAATVAPLTATALGALDDRRAGLASGVNNAASRLAQLLGIAILPVAAGLGGMDDVAGAALTAGFTRACWIAAGALLAGAVVGWVALRER